MLQSVLLCCLTFGCAYIPEQEQLVSATNNKMLSRSNGNCTETALIDDGRKSGTPEAGLTPDNISILDWNIYKGQRLGWQDDFLRLSRTKEIILLQEASLNETLQEILHLKNLYWNFNSAFKYRGVETGVLVASTIQPLDSCGMRQDEPIIGIPKTILISRYRITGSVDKLLVANIHGINITLGTVAYKEQLDALQDILQKHNGPIILAGDFNNWSKKRTFLMDMLVENLSLSVLPFEDDARSTFFGDPVDHILYRGLEPVAHTAHSVTSSDHNPISVTFRLARKQDTT